MKHFPFKAPEFATSEPSHSPLWRPTPGRTYYMPIPDSESFPRVWNGGETDQRRYSSGSVYRSQLEAERMRRYMAALAKLWRYAMLFHIEGENHFHFIDTLDGKLSIWNEDRETIFPRFHSYELARIALDRLSEAEQSILTEGPQWTL